MSMYLASAAWHSCTQYLSAARPLPCIMCVRYGWNHVRKTVKIVTTPDLATGGGVCSQYGCVSVEESGRAAWTSTLPGLCLSASSGLWSVFRGRRLWIIPSNWSPWRRDDGWIMNDGSPWSVVVYHELTLAWVLMYASRLLLSLLPSFLPTRPPSHRHLRLLYYCLAFTISITHCPSFSVFLLPSYISLGTYLQDRMCSQ